jgi:hypothetical protein
MSLFADIASLLVPVALLLGAKGVTMLSQRFDASEAPNASDVLPPHAGNAPPSATNEALVKQMRNTVTAVPKPKRATDVKK